MAETAGESFAFIILFVIFIFVIVLVFAYFLLFGFGFTNSSSCYISSQISNFFYQNLCLTNFFCISSTLTNLGIAPPLLGCSPALQAYSASSTSGQAFSGLTDAMSNCWYQYGGAGNLVVLPNSPGLCSVISLNLDQNVTFYNLTQYMRGVVYTKQVSCINHTAQQSCPNYQQGFSCDTSQPTECTLYTNNYFDCVGQQGYSPVYSGYQLQSIPLYNPNVATTADNNVSAYLCSTGCSLDTSTLNCVNATGQIGNCVKSYTNFCQKNLSGVYNCNVAYESSSDSFLPPQGCTLTEAVNTNSTINITYADYLAPGTNTIFTYKNKTSGLSESVNPNSNLSINKAQLYVLFLNSLVGSRMPPNQISLPSECAPANWYNNYPASGIEYECTRALAAYSALGVKSAYGSIRPGIITTSATISAGYLFGRCASNQQCNDYIDTPAINAFSTAALTTSGLSQCASSLLTFFETLPSYVEGKYNENFLGRNQMYICAVVS